MYRDLVLWCFVLVGHFVAIDMLHVVVVVIANPHRRQGAPAGTPGRRRRQDAVAGQQGGRRPVRAAEHIRKLLSVSRLHV